MDVAMHVVTLIAECALSLVKVYFCHAQVYFCINLLGLCHLPGRLRGHHIRALNDTFFKSDVGTAHVFLSALDVLLCSSETFPCFGQFVFTLFYL